MTTLRSRVPVLRPRSSGLRLRVGLALPALGRRVPGLGPRLRRYRIRVGLVLLLSALGSLGVPVPSFSGQAADLPFSGRAAEPPGPPVVLRVEPPNWWVGHSQNRVRLMIHGRHLRGGRVSTADGGLSVGPARVNDAGSYLFFDLSIDRESEAGARTLQVVTDLGKTEVSFPLLAGLPREGRFLGLSPDDAIYLIMPDRFANGDASNDDPARSRGLLDRSKPRHYHGGDLQGIIDRLGYIKDLGMTAIWLNPVYDNTDRLNFKEAYGGQPSTAYHGYHAEDFYAVDEHQGDVAKLRELTERAHRLGLKVIQDQVANHTGPYHTWLTDPPTPTWFNGTEARHVANTWQTWTLADPHASPQVQKATLEGWFIDVLPDLNQDDPEVARYVVQNTLWWLGMTGMDAIRQDTLPYVPRRFWSDWMAAIKREYPQVTVIGEMLDSDPSLVAFFQGGRARFDGVDSGIDSLFDFPLFFALRRAFGEGRSLREVATVVGHDHLYVDSDRLVTFLGLHDVPRFMNDTGATLEGLKLAFAALFTMRGIPLVYYGDEIALPGAGDPDNRRDFPGGWPEDPRNAFERPGRSPEEQAVVEHVQRLGRLRAALPQLRRGRMVNLEVADQAWVFARVLDDQVAIVALNNATEAAVLDVGVATLGLPEATALIANLGSLPRRDGRRRAAQDRVAAALGRHPHTPTLRDTCCGEDLHVQHQGVSVTA